MKMIPFFLLILVFPFWSTTSRAGSIDYLSNQSAEYIMSFNRNAATDSADIVNYNPAGTVFLPENGLYVNASAQYLFKPYNETFLGRTYRQNEPSIIPNLYTLFKRDAWAAFFAVTVPAGGGRVIWDNGDATTAGLIVQTASGAAALGGGTGAADISGQNIKISSEYVGFTAGAAFKLGDLASISLAPRYIVARRYAKATVGFTMDAIGAVPGNETAVNVRSDFDYDAEGVGGIFGLDLKPVDPLIIGVRYETETPLRFKYDMKKRVADVTGPSPLINAGVSGGLLTQLAALDKDKQKLRYDLPALLGLGLNYRVTREFELMTSYTYYFIKGADWEAVPGDYHNGWEAGLAAAFKVIPALKLGLGYLYTVSGETDDTPYVNENPHLDSWSVGLGATYSLSSRFDLTAAGSKTQYKTDFNNEGTPAEVRFRKVVYNLALGGQYRFDL